MSAIALEDGDSYLSAKTIKKMFDLPNSTFYDLRAKGLIPMPCYPFGENLPRYKKSEIRVKVKKTA